MNGKTTSRREFLLLFGALGTGAAVCSGTAIAGLLLAAARKREDTPEVRLVTATPIPGTPEPTPLPVYAPLVRRAGWGARQPDHNASNENGFYDAEDNPNGWRIYDEPLETVYNTVVIHHSVIDEGDDVATLLEIQRAHREDRDWADVAYHYFVGKDGTIYEGRTLAARGAHVAGFNTGTAGVCVLGDFTQEEPTQVALTAAVRLLRWLADTLDLSHAAGHQAFNANTQCPGTFLINYLGWLAESSGLTLGTDGYVDPTAYGGCNCGGPVSA